MVSNGSQTGNFNAPAGVSRSRMWAIRIVVVSAIVAGGGAVAYWWWSPVERSDSIVERSGFPDHAAVDSGEHPAIAEVDTELEATTFHNPGYVGPQAGAPCPAQPVTP